MAMSKEEFRERKKEYNRRWYEKHDGAAYHRKYYNDHKEELKVWRIKRQIEKENNNAEKDS